MKNRAAGIVSVWVAAVLLPAAYASAPVKEVGDRYQPGSLAVAQTDAARIAGVSAPVKRAFPAAGSSVTLAPTKQRAWTVKTAEDLDDNFETTDTLDDRVKRLEQQTANLANMNLPQEISRLQQEIAELRGQLQQQQHALEQLNNRLASAPQDATAKAPQSTMSPAAVAPPPESANTDSAVTVDAAEASTYQKAFSALAKRDYAGAKQGFNNYLTHFAQGKFAPDAHYWLGEIYLQDKQYSKAETEFNVVLKQFPSAGKVPDARLKLAIIHAAQGNIAQAKQELLDIKKQNPNSTAAQLANIRLQQLEQGSN